MDIMTTVELGIRWKWTLETWRMAEWARWPVSKHSSSLGRIVLLEMDIELDMTTVELGIRWTWTLETWRMAKWARWPVSEYHAPLRHHHSVDFDNNNVIRQIPQSAVTSEVFARIVAVSLLCICYTSTRIVMASLLAV
jgi:hypothetical protein